MSNQSLWFSCYALGNQKFNGEEDRYVLIPAKYNYTGS